MKLRPVEPRSHQRSATFVTRARGCTLEEILAPIYTVPEEARELFRFRKEKGIGLGVAAGKLGIRVVELSGLERGRYVPEDPSDWARMKETLDR